MKKLICFFKGHVPDIKFGVSKTKLLSSGGFTKQRNKPFIVITASCSCKRCGKYFTSRWWTE